MNVKDIEILEFLERFPNAFVSLLDIGKAIGSQRVFREDRFWALPLLLRLEKEGLVESNPRGEYRYKRPKEDTTSFRKALAVPGVVLGDTAIIFLDSARDDEAESGGTAAAGKEGSPAYDVGI